MESRVFYLPQLSYVLQDCLMGEIFPELKEVLSYFYSQRPKTYKMVVWAWLKRERDVNIYSDFKMYRAVKIKLHAENLETDEGHPKQTKIKDKIL